MSEWKIKKSEYLLKHKYLTVRQDICKTKEGRIVNPYFVLEIAPWVQVLAFNNEKQVLVTRQYRHGIQEIIYGLPTGFAEKSDRTPKQAARRELIEETGYDSKKFVKTGDLFPNPALQNNRVHCFAAFEIEKITAPVFDHSEKISCEFMTIKKLLKLIDEGVFRHALHVAGVFVTLRKLKLLKK